MLKLSICWALKPSEMEHSKLKVVISDRRWCQNWQRIFLCISFNQDLSLCIAIGKEKWIFCCALLRARSSLWLNLLNTGGKTPYFLYCELWLEWQLATMAVYGSVLFGWSWNWQSVIWPHSMESCEVWSYPKDKIGKLCIIRLLKIFHIYVFDEH